MKCPVQHARNASMKLMNTNTSNYLLPFSGIIPVQTFSLWLLYASSPVKCVKHATSSTDFFCSPVAASHSPKNLFWKVGGSDVGRQQAAKGRRER